MPPWWGQVSVQFSYIQAEKNWASRALYSSKRDAWKVLSGMLREFYSEKWSLFEPDQKALKSPKHLRVRAGQYVKLLLRLEEESIRKIRPQQGNRNKWTLRSSERWGSEAMAHPRREASELSFYQSRISRTFPPWAIHAAREGQKKDMYIKKLNIEIFYHRLSSPEHLRTFSGLPSISTGKRKKKYWPRIKLHSCGDLTQWRIFRPSTKSSFFTRRCWAK